MLLLHIVRLHLGEKKRKNLKKEEINVYIIVKPVVMYVQLDLGCG